jgi:hypothetical protein
MKRDRELKCGVLTAVGADQYIRMQQWCNFLGLRYRSNYPKLFVIQNKTERTLLWLALTQKLGPEFTDMALDSIFKKAQTKLTERGVIITPAV